MTREEAIRILKKKMHGEADEITIEHLDGSQCMRTINIDLEMKEAIEVLEQPMTLAEFLGWQEGVEYEYEATGIVKVGNNILYVKSEKCSSGWCNFPLFTDEIEDLRQAKKVEPKLKAYYVTDKYSFSELMRELEEQGYMWASGSKLTEKCELNFSNFIFINSGEIITKDSLLRGVYDFNKKYSDKYDLIEYHKEPPKFYAKIKGWEHVEYRPHYWIKAYIRDGWYKELNKSINSNLDTAFPKYKEAYTKEEWNELGINKENADFERCNDD